MTVVFDLDGPDDLMPMQMGAKEVRRHWNAPEVWDGSRVTTAPPGRRALQPDA